MKELITQRDADRSIDIKLQKCNKGQNCNKAIL